MAESRVARSLQPDIGLSCVSYDPIDFNKIFYHKTNKEQHPDDFSEKDRRSKGKRKTEYECGNIETMMLMMAQSGLAISEPKRDHWNRISYFYSHSHYPIHINNNLP